MARPEGFEPPTTWFVVFRFSPRTLLFSKLFYDFNCPIKSTYLALFAFIWGYLAPSIGQL